jgi:hypothetical protein
MPSTTYHKISAVTKIRGSARGAILKNSAITDRDPQNRGLTAL